MELKATTRIYPHWLQPLLSSRPSVPRGSSFIELTVKELGWGAMHLVGESPAEAGLRGDTSAVVVRLGPRYFRHAELESLFDDPRKAKDKLGWTPKTTLEELVAHMVASDIDEVKKEAYFKCNGFSEVGAWNDV